MSLEPPTPVSPRRTPASLKEMKQRTEKIAVLTAYDYPTARLLEESGIDMLLVGDSVGMVVLGYPDTTHVTIDEMVHHTRAAARGTTRALVVADLPFATYTMPKQAVVNARRLMEAGAQAVKLEGGRDQREQIQAIVAEGIPVMAHLGMLPQSVKIEGGYKIKGKTPGEAEKLLDDANAIQEAGAFAVVLELVKSDVAAQITTLLAIPTIGIGSGSDCDGQVLVSHDLIGLFPWFTPKFVKSHGNVAEQIRASASAFIAETKRPGSPSA
ncbi:MAG: 3-methyl-2-oxobutanoate hydroxymethyltransferase [Chthoniobacter sp.]|uniref:3-methyl-2-oxobutanoate hydroxymethyltransferase n=1 Tax=Chthoniobacter sp. TaxID=2510640 RepID=UPI0032A9F621